MNFIRPEMYSNEGIQFTILFRNTNTINHILITIFRYIQNEEVSTYIDLKEHLQTCLHGTYRHFDPLHMVAIIHCVKGC